MGQNLHVDFTPTDTVNYTNASANVTINVLKANATINVMPYHVTYNCNPHTATGTATGVNSEDLSSLLNLGGTTNTDAGDYPSDSWTFNSSNTNPNYNSASGAVHDQIDKADATISITRTAPRITVARTWLRVQRAGARVI